MNEALVVLVRGIIGFFSLLIFARCLGKQQVSQLTLFEYILGITIGSTASTLTTDLSSTAWSHFVGLFVWTALVFLLQWITARSQKAMILVNGEPELLIVNGKILEQKMKSIRYNINDLLEQLRTKDIFDVTQVEFAILETNGELSVLKKSQYQNLTPHDLKLNTSYDGISYELIISGVIIQENLMKINQSKKWLMEELKKKNILNEKDVFLATINSKGEIYIDLFKDHINNVIT